MTTIYKTVKKPTVFEAFNPDNFLLFCQEVDRDNQALYHDRYLCFSHILEQAERLWGSNSATVKYLRRQAPTPPVSQQGSVYKSVMNKYRAYREVEERRLRRAATTQRNRENAVKELELRGYKVGVDYSFSKAVPFLKRIKQDDQLERIPYPE